MTTMSMDQHEFRLPDLGEGVHEGLVIAMHVSEGQQVREDAPLMEVETDKAAVEIPCPVTGRVTRIHVSEQQLVHVGDVMITFEPSGASAPPATVIDTPADPKPIPTAAPAAIPPARRRKPASPSVRRLARELAVDLDKINGSGPGGRVTRDDVRQFVNASVPVQQPGTIASTPPTPTPAARVTPPLQRPSAEIEGTADSDQYGPIVRQSLSQARRTIATVMQTSWQTIPHVTDSNDADITDLETMRASFVDTDNPDRRITTLAFVIRAVCRAVRKHPILNAMLDEPRDEIIFRDYVNIAVGVETPRGLVAPVIRNAHLMGVGELSDHLAVMTHNTRSGAFSVDDTRGATYTISNAGAMGRTRYSTPIIMPGTVACLALGRARKMPWVVDGEILPRLILPLSHSMDHRLVDGGREIPFIGHVIDDLEHPMRFSL
ncbi:MAG: 2-oxo acid dehydrogenase subunit E2 [Planctomycetes bacterium]|nr:2-oxo acid dehydrogenase subunit E2 [Planctomycetota bacterium]MCP4837955.1 2-oxo acid dehydrogenase subunit E2 [Planctomycetota bacterium]